MAEQHNAERPSRDRRRRPRAQVVCEGEYVALDGGLSSRWERCSLLDLSLDGAALAVHAGELHHGQQILLRLDDQPTWAHAPVEFQAVVVNRRRRTDPNVYGLVFPALSPGEKKQLLRIIITAYQESAPSPR
jgi:c-di-GMP-binding flagellar brake protein YcgR